MDSVEIQLPVAQTFFFAVARYRFPGAVGFVNPDVFVIPTKNQA